MIAYLELFAPMSTNQGVKYLFTKKAIKSVAPTALEKRNNFYLRLLENTKELRLTHNFRPIKAKRNAFFS